MDDQLIELYVQRGRLRERIAAQRGQLARELAPLGSALQSVDRARALVGKARLWLAAHPMIVTAAVVALVVWRPRTVFRSLRWGYSAWRRWARMRQWVNARYGAA